MLDPRIYRSAFVPVALAAIVFLFSLSNQAPGLSSTLAPDAFNDQNAYASLTSLAGGYPDRHPGSVGDAALGSAVAGTLSRLHMQVTTDSFVTQTAVGKRTVQNVTAVAPGLSSRRIVILAPRDSLADGPDPGSLSATAVMLELARVISERTLQRTVVFGSVSAGAGGGGFERVLSEVGGPVDAALVLGDLAGPRLRPPLVIPFSDRAAVAPPALRNTVTQALMIDAGARAGGIGLADQFARLAFPLTLGGQGPLAGGGWPAVLLSTAGERGPAGAEAPSQLRLRAFGRAALRVLTALQQGPDLPAPSAYMIYNRKLIPAWAVRVLILTLILPALVAGIDGLARARRRGHRVGPLFVWALAASVPFLMGAGVLRLAGAFGVLRAAPREPVIHGAAAPGAPGIATLVIAVLVLVAGLRWLWPALGRIAGTRGDPAEEGGGVAVLLAMCATTIALWAIDPFAAALAIPALHLWMWTTEPDLRMRLPGSILLLAIGLVPPVLIAVVYRAAFATGIPQLGWAGLSWIAGGGLAVASAVAWCVLAGCTTATAVLAARLWRRERPVEAPVTVRGPVTYAGPGSLGGTQSALGRRR